MDKNSQPMPLWKKILVGFGLLWVVGFASSLIIGGNESKPSPASSTQAVSQKTKEPTIGELVSIKKFSWSLEGFNSVLVADMTIENKNKIDLKDFVVECDTVSKSGTHLSTVKTVVYEVLPAGKAKSFKRVNVGFVHSQSAKASCNVIGAFPRQAEQG